MFFGNTVFLLFTKQAALCFISPVICINFKARTLCCQPATDGIYRKRSQGTRVKHIKLGSLQK